MEAANSLMTCKRSGGSSLSNASEMTEEKEYRITVTYERPDVKAHFINTYNVLVGEMPLEKTKSTIKLAFTLAHPSWPILSVDAYADDGLPHPLPRAALEFSPSYEVQKTLLPAPQFCASKQVPTRGSFWA